MTLTRDAQPAPVWVTCYQPQVTQSVQGLLPNIRFQSIIHVGRVGQGEEEMHLEARDQASPRQNCGVQIACVQRPLLFAHTTPFSEIMFSWGRRRPSTSEWRSHLIHTKRLRVFCIFRVLCTIFFKRRPHFLLV